MPGVSFENLIAAGRSGHLISFPTDTVPALAARPDRASLIYQAKQRDLSKPIILMMAEIDQLWDYVLGSLEERQQWQYLMHRHWPGALTLVLPASDRVSPEMNPLNPGTIGVRVPDHDLARRILAQTGALATTSANQSGQPALLEMSAIAQQFPEAYQLAIEPGGEESARLSGTAASGTPSTVVKWAGQGWQLLRQGAIAIEAS
ncbi:MAG: L-threonylcarbamoyladenylate synthase [Synechococcales bacterium]|nr:L-threonylcarbamoyladenylate synthase [Synechococcales bacterium]